MVLLPRWSSPADRRDGAGQLPTIGAQLTAVAGNLQMGVAGALATALAIMLYELVMEGVTGLTGANSAGNGRRRDSH